VSHAVSHILRLEDIASELARLSLEVADLRSAVAQSDDSRHSAASALDLVDRNRVFAKLTLMRLLPPPVEDVKVDFEWPVVDDRGLGDHESKCIFPLVSRVIAGALPGMECSRELAFVVSRFALGTRHQVDGKVDVVVGDRFAVELKKPNRDRLVRFDWRAHIGQIAGPLWGKFIDTDLHVVRRLVYTCHEQWLFFERRGATTLCVSDAVTDPATICAWLRHFASADSGSVGAPVGESDTQGPAGRSRGRGKSRRGGGGRRARGTQKGGAGLSSAKSGTAGGPIAEGAKNDSPAMLTKDALRELGDASGWRSKMRIFPPLHSLSNV
jgi:hypothetical protein